ncbi:MAG: hypothetical protein A4E30_00931 [Methanomassiliicoccales archaeon PtaB.Bin215]|nr:MAG: hypothetical protein A4E30_00931 [Methanomassiliicoccales archaeon PtaB.Bin215]
MKSVSPVPRKNTSSSDLSYMSSRASMVMRRSAPFFPDKEVWGRKTRSKALNRRSSTYWLHGGLFQSAKAFLIRTSPYPLA